MVPPSLVVPGPSPRPPHPVGPVRPIRRGPVPSAPEYPRPARPPPWQSVPCPPWTRPPSESSPRGLLSEVGLPTLGRPDLTDRVPQPVLGASPRPHRQHLTPRQMLSTGFATLPEAWICETAPRTSGFATRSAASSKRTWSASSPSSA